MVGQILGEVPEWVADGGSWLSLGIGLATLIALGYGFARWLRHSLIHAVSEIVDTKLEPLRGDHERAATESRRVRDELREHMRTEEALAQQSAEWRASVDLALRNLQQESAERITRDR